ncbi:MAG: NAD(P)H-hydrate epimerase [Actinomycetota bacterium]
MRFAPLAVPEILGDQVAWIDESSMIEVDRVMIEDLHIELIQMMENAGRHLARAVLDGVSPATVAVAAGSGGNGGGGLVAARHLANAGVDVTVVTTRPAEAMGPVPAHQFDILQRMGVAFRDELPPADATIDAVIGYSLRGAPRGASAALIGAMEAADVVVSLDTPSGLDVTTGATPGAVVMAQATVTLALPKLGLRNAPSVGQLYLADISVPPAVTSAYGSPPPPFGPEGLLRVR